MQSSKIDYSKYFPRIDRVMKIAAFGKLKVAIFIACDYADGYEDYQALKAYYSDVEFTTKDNADFLVEFTRPSLDRKFISEDVNVKPSPEMPTKFEISCESLIKTAIEKLRIGLEREQHLRRLSAILAQYDGHRTVAAQHAAEILGYIDPYDLQNESANIFVEAESCILHVGKGITINPLQTKDSDIDKAIAILTEMKQKAPIY
jgi:hypothetical protein